nr:uncharacterized protein LOC125184178 isoform X2 [Anser cygnoides]
MRSATVLAAGISGRLLILAPNRADLNLPQAEAPPWNLPEGSMGAALAGSRRFRVALRAHFSANKSNGCCHHSLWDHPGEHHLWLIPTITDEMIAVEKLPWFDASLTMTDEYRTCPAAHCTHHRAVWEMPGRASICGWQLNPWSTRHTARIVILIEEGHHNEHFKGLTSLSVHSSEIKTGRFPEDLMRQHLLTVQPFLCLAWINKNIHIIILIMKSIIEALSFELWTKR